MIISGIYDKFTFQEPKLINGMHDKFTFRELEPPKRKLLPSEVILDPYYYLQFIREERVW